MEEMVLRGWRSPTALFAAFFAGVVNGWLGTGGGMLLVLVLGRLYPERWREVFSLTTACTFAFSTVSILLYAIGGHVAEVDLLPILLPAFFGGILGSLLLGKSSPAALRALLALLLAFSGIRLLL